MFDFLKILFKKSVISSHKEKNCHSTICKKADTCPKRDTCPRAATSVARTVNTEVPAAPVVEEIKAEPVIDQVEEIAVEREAVEKIKDNTEGAYVIKTLKGDIYKFDLTGPEGKTVIRSGEYTLKRSCVSGIQSVQKNGATENVEDRTADKIVKAPNPKYEIFLDEAEKYRFSLKAPNGYVILTSNAYVSKKSCLKAIENVRLYSKTEKVINKP